MLARNLLAGASLVAAVSAAPVAHALTFTESLTAPQAPAGSVVTALSLQGVTPVPNQSTITGTGYTVTFTGVPASQGVVQGDLANVHAVPVAGVMGGAPMYLTGDSLTGPYTTNIAASGKYLSTDDGAARITITFATPETSFAFLAGSIDASNLITLSNGDTLTGAQLQAVPGFAGNGNQGFGGSAYVALTDSAFTSVTLSSGVVSFEMAGAEGSNTPFLVPEPVSLALFGTALTGLGLVRRRFRA